MSSNADSPIASAAPTSTRSCARASKSQLEVIESRRAAHTLASKRCEFVDAEIDRLRQQLSLVREQALLATDEGSVARSVDALSASLNEANRWLKDQRELFAGFETFSDDAAAARAARAAALPRDLARAQETDTGSLANDASIDPRAAPVAPRSATSSRPFSSSRCSALGGWLVLKNNGPKARRAPAAN